MRKLIVFLLSISMVLAVGTAYAPLVFAEDDEAAADDAGAFDEDAGAEEEEGGQEEEVHYKKMTEYDFDEILLEGELKRPTGSTIIERKDLRFKNLIKFRENFEPEMIKSVDKLK